MTCYCHKSSNSTSKITLKNVKYFINTYDSHYHLEVQANSKKNCTKKKPMLFLASMGEMGLSHDFFFEFSKAFRGH